MLRIPTRALIEGKRVYVLDQRRGRVELRDVKTGIGNWEYTEIRSGLEPQELVVTSIDREGLADGVRARASAKAATGE